MRWLVAAHPKEIPGFSDLSSDSLRAIAVGVGQFASLARLAALTADNKPSAIILAGTAGSERAADVGKIFHCNHFAFPSVEWEDLPEFLCRNFATSAALESQTLPGATVLQNHGVSLSIKKFLSNQGYVPENYPRPVLENMEACSLALHCLGHEIPFSAILCVTNTVGPDARQQWRSNFHSAGKTLREALRFCGVIP